MFGRQQSRVLTARSNQRRATNNQFCSFRLHPIHDELNLDWNEFGVCVGIEVGGKGHVAFLYFLDGFFKLVVLTFFVVGRKFGEVKLLLAFLNVVIEPPAYRVDSGVSRVRSLIGVAVVAGGFWWSCPS